MAFADVKGIALTSGFKLEAESLLDVRGAVDDITGRDELVTLHAAPVGLIVFVKSESDTSYSTSPLPAPNSLIKPHRQSYDEKLPALKPKHSKIRSKTCIRKAASSTSSDRMRLQKLELGKASPKR